MRRFFIGLAAVSVIALVGCGGGGSHDGGKSDPGRVTVATYSTFHSVWEAYAGPQELGRFYVFNETNESVALSSLTFFVPPGVNHLGFELYIDGELYGAPWSYSGSSESGWTFVIEPDPALVIRPGKAVDLSFWLTGIMPDFAPMWLDWGVYLGELTIIGEESDLVYPFTGAYGPEGVIVQGSTGGGKG